MWITDIARKVVNALFPKLSIEKELGIRIAVSSAMETAIQDWSDMYLDRPYWKANGTKTMNLPASIAHEFARLVLVENEYEVTGSQMAEYLNKQLHNDLKNIYQKMELYCAKGGIVIKPYVNGDKIELDFTQADSFYPTDYDSNGKITGAVFVDQVKEGDYVYTRLETHNFTTVELYNEESGENVTNSTHTITNRAYKSEKIYGFTTDDDIFSSVMDPLHEEVPLTEVDEWASLETEVVITDIDRPLFTYIKVPAANNIDTKSPLGVSVYSRAVESIKNCDEQYSESKFEFEAFEAAIDATDDLFKKTKDGESILPSGKERVFRSYQNLSGDAQGSFMKEFAPAFRDQSLFNGLDHYLKVVESNTDLPYGTFSDPNSTEKTATEVLASKNRCYTAVSNMQGCWDEGLQDVVYAMWVLANLYELAPAGEYEWNATWGDGVLEDIDKEYQRRFALVQAGKLKPEKLLSWYFGVSEEEALEMIPQQVAIPGYE